MTEDTQEAPAAQADPAHPHAIDPATQLSMYRAMVQCRHLGLRAHQLFLEGLVKGSTHMSMGQEAIAAGFGAAMRGDDYTFCTYRGHAHTLARGVSMQALLLELTGRAGGLMNGKGGSMHLTSVAHGVMGSYAIVGAHLPVALGAAWSAQLRGSGQVAVCFFGDGTTNIGAFHEALNLAVVWKVPAVFVCENNLYMEYTPIRDVTAVPNPAADRASAYGLERVLIDGNDVDIVHHTARRFIDRARRGEGPALIEAITYRHGGHSRGDLGKYRPESELQSWLARDPIPSYRARLLAANVPERDLADIEATAQALVDEAERAVRAADPPSADTLLRDVWADGGSAWRN
jgi:TPP-dependent pyruvate/acetoin dehydrogenase alpha subunit